MVRGDLGLPAARALRARGDARRPPSVARVGLTTPKSGRTLRPRRRTQRTDMKKLLVLTLSLALAVGLVSAPSLAAAGDQDRKSTRLNSSHLVISYAVFCLKKKKKNK